MKKLKPTYWIAFIKACFLWIRIKRWKSIDRGRSCDIRFENLNEHFISNNMTFLSLMNGTDVTSLTEQSNQNKYI